MSGHPAHYENTSYLASCARHPSLLTGANPLHRAGLHCVLPSPAHEPSDNESVGSQLDLSASAPSLSISPASAPSLQVPQFAARSGLSLMSDAHIPPPPPPATEAATAHTQSAEAERRVESIVYRNVYISGLPSYMQSSEFRELCQRFGRVEASKLCVEGPSNPTKGYGFVLYYTEESAALCIKELSGSYLNGRCLQARLADTHATPRELPRRVPPPPPPPAAPLPAYHSGHMTSSLTALPPPGMPVSAMYPPPAPAYYLGPSNSNMNSSLTNNASLYSVNHSGSGGGGSFLSVMPQSNVVVMSTPTQMPVQFIQQPSSFLVGANSSVSLSQGEAGCVALPGGAYYTSAPAGQAVYSVQPPPPQQQQTHMIQTYQVASVPGAAGPHIVSGAPMMVAGAPSNTVQYISLNPAPGSMPQ